MAKHPVGNSAEVSNPTPPPGSTGTGTGMNLPPEDPQCVGHMGSGDTCWGEWLKEPASVPANFKPVAKGALGAGPWPTTAEVNMGGAEGLEGPILDVSVDTAENIYAVSDSALFIRRAGQAKFERYDRATNGLQDFPFLSVAGGAPGEAYVGHVGDTPDSEFNDPPTDPPEVRHSGDMERIDLTPTGITTKYYDTHNSNSPNGEWDHTRTINNIVIPRRGPAAGEVYLSTEHATVRYIGDQYVDHRHVSVDFGGSTHYGAATALAVTDDGTMWYGSTYMFGGLAWTPRRYEWYFTNNWLFPTNSFSDEATADNIEGIGVDSKGGIWAACRGWGLSHLAIHGRSGDLEQITDMPDNLAMDLKVDPADDTIWVAADSGLYRYYPATKTWKKYDAAGDHLTHVFVDDTVTPRAVWAGNNNGIYVYRGD